MRLTAPTGWVGREINGGLLLGCTTLPDLLLVLPHGHRDLAALRAEAEASLGDGAARSLELRDTLERIGEAALGGEFHGRFDGEPATGFVLALLNPQGNGLTVMAITETA